MEYVAVEIKGSIYVMNDMDELGGLIDNDIPHKVLGVVCEDREYGDRCNANCEHFCMGTCRAKTMRDAFGDLWSVLSSENDREG